MFLPVRSDSSQRERATARARRSEWVGLLLAVLLACGVACSNYKDLLQRAQGYYEDNDYERALTVFRHLDAERMALSSEQRVRYFYLRGMTDYRLGYDAHARYWLGLCQAQSGEPGAGLREAETARLAATLAALNRDVYQQTQHARTEASPKLVPCQKSSDCGRGLLCLRSLCRPTEEAVRAELLAEPNGPDAAPPAPPELDAEPNGPGAAPPARPELDAAPPERGELPSDAP